MNGLITFLLSDTRKIWLLSSILVSQKNDVNALQEEKALKKGYNDAKKECKEAKDEEEKFKKNLKNGAKTCCFYNKI